MRRVACEVADLRVRIRIVVHLREIGPDVA